MSRLISLLKFLLIIFCIIRELSRMVILLLTQEADAEMVSSVDELLGKALENVGWQVWQISKDEV